MNFGVFVLTLLGVFPSLINGQFSSVYFVKERNVQSRMTEVHALDSARGYSVPTSHYVTVFGENEWPNGQFEVAGGNVVGGDLFYVKLRNTGTGRVEIHRATAGSNYKSFAVQTGTAFDLADANRGTWRVDDGDLYFIKTRETGSGRIEVHRASRSNYGNYDLHQATSLSQSNSDLGTWTIVGKNLYFIKYRNTNGANVEVHKLTPGDGYQRVTLLPTWFNIADGDNGTWEIGTNGDLYFIKTRNTGSGKIEVHIATAVSGYQNVAHFASWVSEADGPNGSWWVR
ncbi:hypothetical protein HJFPF1_13296 [Paramyrothecium foliicola]|nr:hypothetical protein HJFPF1_13296 [Paramyrothecium foliicola]